MGAQRRERRRLLAARPATLRSSRARAHRVYVGELGRARVAAGEAEEEARRDTERRMWEAAGRATASPAGGEVVKVDYEANRRALVERKADELRRRDDRRWERLGSSITGSRGGFSSVRRALICLFSFAIVDILFVLLRFRISAASSRSFLRTVCFAIATSMDCF